MRKNLVLLLLLLSMPFVAQTLPSLWVIPEGEPIDKANIVGEGVISTTNYQYPEGTDDVPMRDYLLQFEHVKLKKGTYVEVDFSFRADTKDAPSHYLLERQEGKKIVPIDTIKAVMEHPANGEFATSLHTIYLPRSQKNIALRLRSFPDRLAEGGSRPVAFAHQSNVGVYVHVLGTARPTDTLRVLCIGNSFTYVYQAPFMLKQLAWSRGHYIEMRAALRGGYNFGDHLGMQGTDEAIREGGYDYVFLQNQSQTNAWYGQDSVKNRQTLQDAEELVRRIRKYSPNAKIVIESTWSYPGGNCGGFGSLERYDELMEQGSRWIAEKVDGRVSYINRAFERARALYPGMAIYGGDAKHQSAYGSYLKACVNYSVLYGEALPVAMKKQKGNEANPNLWFDEEVARQLRHAASEAVK